MSNSLIVPVHVLRSLTKTLLLQLATGGGIAVSTNNTVAQLCGLLEGTSIAYRRAYLISPTLPEDCTLAEVVLKKLLTEGKIELPVPEVFLLYFLCAVI